MKKKHLIPIGIGGALALGIYARLAGGGAMATASVGDAIDLDSLNSKTEEVQEPATDYSPVSSMISAADAATAQEADLESMQDASDTQSSDDSGVSAPSGGTQENTVPVARSPWVYSSTSTPAPMPQVIVTADNAEAPSPLPSASTARTAAVSSKSSSGNTASNATPSKTVNRTEIRKPAVNIEIKNDHEKKAYFYHDIGQTDFFYHYADKTISLSHFTETYTDLLTEKNVYLYDGYYVNRVCVTHDKFLEIQRKIMEDISEGTCIQGESKGWANSHNVYENDVTLPEKPVPTDDFDFEKLESVATTDNVTRAYYKDGSVATVLKGGFSVGLETEANYCVFRDGFFVPVDEDEYQSELIKISDDEATGLCFVERMAGHIENDETEAIKGDVEVEEEIPEASEEEKDTEISEKNYETHLTHHIYREDGVSYLMKNTDKHGNITYYNDEVEVEEQAYNDELKKAEEDSDLGKALIERTSSSTLYSIQEDIESEAEDIDVEDRGETDIEIETQDTVSNEAVEEKTVETVETAVDEEEL